jgi:FkbM family methyltransferase
MPVLKRLRNRLERLNKWRDTLGLPATLQWLLLRLSHKLGVYRPLDWQVRPHQLPHTLKARLRESSDMSVFGQIFVDEEYACLRDLKSVSLVLDLGANVGFSSVYFLSSFPGSRLVAVEPDERNVAVCQANLMAYGNRALLLHGAAWSERTRLRLSRDTFGDGREWSTQVRSPADGSAGEIEAWDVGTLIEMAGAQQVDLLKVDIERAELAVFGDTAKLWLPRIRNICIELHGPDCQQVFFRALKDFDYELGHSGELTVCRNLRLKSQTGIRAGSSTDSGA